MQRKVEVEEKTVAAGSPERLSYRGAGVDIDAQDRALGLIKGYVQSTYGPQVLSDFGSFGPTFALKGYREPVLVASADGVGTKLKLAFLLDRHDTIGIDIVNHCVNDILTTGAEPLFFLDYFATGQLKPETLAAVVKGLGEACRAVGCALLGGETAEMPSFYAPGEYDLAGFIVGCVEKDAVIDGKGIRPGDVALGLPSTGLHTNGYSLARQAFGITSDVPADEAVRRLETFYPELGRTLGDALLEPHRCYLNELRPILGKLKGIAHITGGGLRDNTPRILPADVAVRFDTAAWDCPPVFGLIERLGNVERLEMYRAFNMGIGIVVVVSPSDAAGIQAVLPEVRVIGEVVPRTGAPVEIA
jgi:phosphoribosylformylglycinamidine cyclo-ligase